MAAVCVTHSVGRKHEQVYASGTHRKSQPAFPQGRVQPIDHRRLFSDSDTRRRTATHHSAQIASWHTATNAKDAYERSVLRTTGDARISFIPGLSSGVACDSEEASDLSFVGSVSMPVSSATRRSASASKNLSCFFFLLSSDYRMKPTVRYSTNGRVQLHTSSR